MSARSARSTRPLRAGRWERHRDPVSRAGRASGSDISHSRPLRPRTEGAEARASPGGPALTPVDAAEFERALHAGVRVLDLRPAAARAKGELPGAQGLLLDELQAGNVPDAPRDEPLVLVCERGLISELAALYLEAEGFRDVRHLTGGLRAWRAGRGPG